VEVKEITAAPEWIENTWRWRAAGPTDQRKGDGGKIQAIRQGDKPRAGGQAQDGLDSHLEVEVLSFTPVEEMHHLEGS
jgi:hypothetical protein